VEITQCTNTHVVEFLRREEGKKWVDRKIKEILSENFSNLLKKTMKFNNLRQKNLKIFNIEYSNCQRQRENIK
jgi:hypothetical protein